MITETNEQEEDGRIAELWNQGNQEDFGLTRGVQNLVGDLCSFAKFWEFVLYFCVVLCIWETEAGKFSEKTKRWRSVVFAILNRTFAFAPFFFCGCSSHI